MVIIPGFPALTDHSVTVVLADAAWRIRFSWNERMSGWYWDLRNADGVAVALGQRLTAGTGYTMRRGVGPAGLFYCNGVDGYKQEDLGGALQLVFIPADQLPAQQVNSQRVLL